MGSNSDGYLLYIQKELAPLYFKVKQVIIEAENFDPLKMSYIAPFNELRSTLDHIMKAALNSEINEELMGNLFEAKVHLNRAGYDVYEIFASNLGLAITKSIEKYPSENISKVFPAYYNSIQPLLIEVQQGLSDVRSKKNVDGSTNPESFVVYEKLIDKLIKIYKDIQLYIPLLEKERKRGIVRFIINNGISIAVALISGIIIGYLIFKFDW